MIRTASSLRIVPDARRKCMWNRQIGVFAPPPRARASAPLVHGRDRIRYRVVDEYNGDTLSEKRTRSSKRPSSEVYPQFEAGILARIDGWYEEGERE